MTPFSSLASTFSIWPLGNLARKVFATSSGSRDPDAAAPTDAISAHARKAITNRAIPSDDFIFGLLVGPSGVTFGPADIGRSHPFYRESSPKAIDRLGLLRV